MLSEILKLIFRVQHASEGGKVCLFRQGSRNWNRTFVMFFGFECELGKFQFKFVCFYRGRKTLSFILLCHCLKNFQQESKAAISVHIYACSIIL